MSRRTYVLAATLWWALSSCAPPPDHAVLELGTREVRFHRADLESGGGTEPVWIRLRAKTDDGQTSLDLTLRDEPGVNLSRFAGKTYTSAAAAGRPGSATLEVTQQSAAGAAVARATDLVVEVHASAPGIMQADAKGVLAPDGVPIRLHLERR